MGFNLGGRMLLCMILITAFIGPILRSYIQIIGIQPEGWFERQNIQIFFSLFYGR